MIALLAAAALNDETHAAATADRTADDPQQNTSEKTCNGLKGLDLRCLAVAVVLVAELESDTGCAHVVALQVRVRYESASRLQVGRTSGDLVVSVDGQQHAGVSQALHGACDTGGGRGCSG